ncbi:hypothetical protein P3X46_000123 [Hevea brasiliensis]|uniref:Glycosyl transferase 64 domain-containing protein n=1 Tax=Hevea brasiliensis TaxID=3981 RepID=A0ABQ9NAF5_HEVBR|nr:hypothetical protein P3X46_000123 [Hevea brasiliensis]
MVNVLSYVCLLLPLRLCMFSLHTLPSDPCEPKKELDPRNLRADHITVLINGYSESRIPLLQTIAATYSASSLVSSVLPTWLVISPRSSFGLATISLVRQPSSSLNDRFLPRSSIGTQAVLICNDDVEVDPKSFNFAFQIWRLNPDRLIGLFVRSHDLDLLARKWIYNVHPDKYSIVLTKFMILKSQYLFEYGRQGGSNMSKMRGIIDQMQNCEDILMNFVVADKANAGPILVEAEKDAKKRSVRAVGLSSRREEHRKRRGDYIREFHNLLGRPLRYSFGKVVNSVGEQGLCMKGDKLVFCDQYQ